ncbi:MAG: hypothetical protein ACR2LI_01060 [Propionibacteriaceae bacterium]
MSIATLVWVATVVSVVVDVEVDRCGNRVHDLATVMSYGTLSSPHRRVASRVLANMRTVAAVGELAVSLRAVLLKLLAFYEVR